MNVAGFAMFLSDGNNEEKIELAVREKTNEAGEIWVCHYKDSASVWAQFSTDESARQYMRERGGCFSVRRGEVFDPAWINAEIEYRRRFDFDVV